MTLSRGEKTGEVLGVLKLSPFSSENVVGLGDPGFSGKGVGEKGGGGGKEVLWENLNCTSKWTHSTYEFEFRGRRFTWLRTKMRVWGDQPDLELRENVESTLGQGEKGKGNETTRGEVLAVYKGCQGFVSRKRGTFWIRKGGAGFSDARGRLDYGASSSSSAVEWGDWETMVLLTGCGIIEASRRRARQRRRGGGGG